MTVTLGVELTATSFGATPHGYPHGILSASALIAGDGGGGNVQMDFEVASDDYLVYMRGVWIANQEAAAIDFFVNKGPDQLTGTGSIGLTFFAVGASRQLEAPNFIPYYWMAGFGEETIPIQVISSNAATRQWIATVQGFYWHLSVLRQQGIGPVLLPGV